MYILKKPILLFYYQKTENPRTQLLREFVLLTNERSNNSNNNNRDEEYERNPHFVKIVNSKDMVNFYTITIWTPSLNSARALEDSLKAALNNIQSDGVDTEFVNDVARIPGREGYRFVSITKSSSKETEHINIG